jgi:hypothetical protein
MDLLGGGSPELPAGIQPAGKVEQKPDRRDRGPIAQHLAIGD